MTPDPETWVDEHADALFRFALVRLRDRTAAEEVVQETFLAALQSSDRFEGRSSERTWLVGILKFKILDHFRRTVRERPHEEDAAIDAGEDLFEPDTGFWHHDTGPHDWGIGPVEAVERDEFREALRTCLDGISPRMAAAFSMREMDELSTEEICKVLGVTATNLWVILHRARGHLRLCLERSWLRR